MSIKRVSPKEAAELTQQGYTYVDVRSTTEFENGRPQGAVNVPLMHADPARGMVPNAEFLDVMKKRFPSGSKIVLGCQGGNRSMRAAEMLQAQGWNDLIEQRAGFGGARDMSTGRVVEPGWADAGLPVESGPAPGRDWASLSKG